MEHRLIPAQAAPEAIREEMLLDQDYLVIPMVALVEGVIQCANCENPELVVAEEFAKVIQSWDGRPLTINHPQRNGSFISANSPDVFENENIGSIFNSKLEDGKLKVEGWIDLSRIEGFPEAEQLVENMKAGDQVEISTGYFADIRPMRGVFNGQRFNGRQTDIKPDHLALLTDERGACNWEMGCGAPRLNSEYVGCKCGGVCESCKRNETHKDKFMALEIALGVKDPESFIWIVDIIDNSVVFMKEDKLMKLDFTINEDGSVNLSEEPVSVRPVTDFVPVVVNEESATMPNEELVDELVANVTTQFTDEDKEWLLALDDDKLNRLKPQEEKAPETLTEYIEKAPTEFKELMQSMHNKHQKARSELVDNLSKETDFESTELETFPLEHLEKMANMIKPPEIDFGGRNSPSVNREDDEKIPPMPVVLEMKKGA